MYSGVGATGVPRLRNPRTQQLARVSPFPRQVIPMTITGPGLDVWEHAARAFELRAPDPVREAVREEAFKTPGSLARFLVHTTVQTPALGLVDQALQDVMDTPDGRLIITMPPQEGKSTRVAKDFIVWVLKHRPWTRVVGASYGQGLANRNGRAIRNIIRSNPELGLTLAADNGSASEWEIDRPTGQQRGGLVSVGIGAGLTGRPADLLVIDDPVKDRKEAESETYQQAVWDWWTDVASTRLAPGAPVVLILTRWHEKDLAGKLLAAPDGHLWRVLNIPAQAEHEDDPLGRKVGEYLESARGRTREQWEAIKLRVGSRSWASMYQGSPTAPAGTIFKRTAWQHYDTAQWTVRDDGSYWALGFDEIGMSWDMTFKGTSGSDMVVGQVWGRRGVDMYLLDQVRGQWDFVETCRQLRLLAAKWPQALLKLVEDKANGSAVLAQLGRTVPGMVPVEPDGGKEARAAAVSPLVESANVWLPAPEIAAWVGALIDEAAAFPNGSFDDQCDALTQALNRMVLQPLLAGQDLVTAEDLFEDMADFGAYVP